MKLLQPDQREARALARLSANGDAEVLLGYLNRNVAVLQDAGCAPDNDARARQAQGAWMVLRDLATKVVRANETLDQLERR
jgi:hypothetical protein